MSKHHKSSTKKTFSWIQGAWTSAGLILLCGSVLAFSRTNGDLLSIAVPLGVAMLFAGCVNIIIYRKKKKALHSAQWLLADGMSTALLSLFLLFNQMIVPAMIPFFFGVWELFSGILKVIDSRELKEDKIRGWHWFTGIGTIEILSGIAALLKPIEEYVGMNIVVGIILLVQSCGFLFKILVYPELAKKKEVYQS